MEKIKKKRWKYYFKDLLNEEFPMENQNKVEWNKGLIDKKIMRLNFYNK